MGFNRAVSKFSGSFSFFLIGLTIVNRKNMIKKYDNKRNIGFKPDFRKVKEIFYDNLSRR